MTESTKHKLTGIQYLRGYAALMVVVCHSSTMFALDKYFGYEVFNGILQSGSKGVELFFTLSGYIIAYTTLTPDLSPKTSIASFARRRAFRLLPMMWLSVLAYFLLRSLLIGQQETGPYVRAATLFPLGTVSPNVIWTLRHEFLFYLVVGASFALRRYWKYVTLAWILSPLIYFSTSSSQGSELAGFFFSKLNLLFGVGICVAVLDLKGLIKSSASSKNVLIILTLCCLAIIVGDHLYFAFSGDKRETPNSLSIIYYLVLGGFCAITLAVARCMGSAQPSRRIERLLFRLGEASYSIYLFHEMFLSLALSVLAKRFSGTWPWLVILSSSCFAILATYSIYWFVERPLLNLLRDRNRKQTEIALVPNLDQTTQASSK